MAWIKYIAEIAHPKKLLENLNVVISNVFNNIESSARGTASENDVKGLFDDFTIGRLLIAVFVTLILAFMCVIINIMKIVVLDDKFVIYSLRKKEFKFEETE